MRIKEISSGKIIPAEVLPVEKSDYILLTKRKYFFDWQAESKAEVYKLVESGKNDILGVISIERITRELRIHIRLLTVSKENKGGNKRYEYIVGNLLTHVAKIAVQEFGEFACVSLKPKTSIAQHYVTKYGMQKTGLILSLEFPGILNLINEYDHD